MYQILEKYGNQEQAIKWAKEIESVYSGEDYANHKPCSTVYKLVEELIGKSDILNQEIATKYKEGK